jgi:hypothetical protein
MLHLYRAVLIIDGNDFEKFAVRTAIPATDFRDFYPMFLCLALSLQIQAGCLWSVVFRL